MGYFDEEEYFEPSAVDEVVQEAVDSLMGYIKEDVQKRINKDREENEILRERIKKLEAQVQTYKNRETEVKRREQTLEQDFFKKKWKDVSGLISDTMYGVTHKYIKQKKCNCCNDKRKVTFTDADGHSYEVKCKCDNSVPVAVPKEHRLLRMYIHKSPYRDLSVECNYFNMDSDNDDYVCVRASQKPIEELPKDLSTLNEWRAAFATRELCQKYCDWKNRDVDKSILDELQSMPKEDLWD